MPNDPSFWESPEQVERFAGFEPDDRLIDLLSRRQDGRDCRALDLGCAGGRNAESLVRAGCETWALDLSAAMAAATHRRLSDLDAPAGRRHVVLRGRFDQLPLAGGCFDLVVAIGIYIQANSDAEFRAGLAETHRVLKPGGYVFVTQWSPETLPADARHVRGQQYIYASRPGETRCRLSGDELAAEMAQSGMALDGVITQRSSEHNGERRIAIVGVLRKR